MNTIAPLPVGDADSVGHAAAPLPTVVAYDTEGALVRPVGAPLRATVMVAASWPLACLLSTAADVVLLTRADGSGADVLGLSRAVRAAGRAPVVVRARLTTSERAALMEVASTRAVPYHASGAAVWDAVQAATSVGLLHAVAEGLRRSRLSDALRVAVVALCTLDPPPTSVAALAAHAGVHRRTLWYQWGTRTRGSARLEDAVMAVVLLRASVRWADGVSWRDAARQLGVHWHTLSRAAHRAGMSALPSASAAFADAAHASIRGLVVINLARPLLRGQALRELEVRAAAPL